MKSFPLTRLFVIIFFFLETLNLKSQINDSLIVIYKNASHDTIRVRVLLNIVSKICDSNPDSAIKTLTACQSICNKNFKIKNINPSTLYNFKLLSANTQLSLAYAYMLIGKMNEAAQIYRSVIPILKQLKNFDVLSNAYVFYASYYLNIGKLDTANYYAQISLKEAQKIKHGKLIAQAENILGLISDYKGDYVSALKYYLDGLKIASTTNDNKGIANFYRNIGGIYETQNKLDEAMKYYQNALKLRLKNNDEINVAESYNTIAIIYRKMNNLNEALIFNSKALEIQKMVHDMPGLALTYNNISVVYHDMKIYDKAANFLEKGIEVQIKINDLNGLSYSYNNLAVLNQENKKYDKAIFYANKSLSIAEKIAFPSLIDQSAKTLYNLYKKINNYQKALEYFTLHIKMRDSINNVDAQKLVIEQQANFEYSQKKAIEDVKHKLELSKQDDLAKAEKNKQRIVILSVTTLLIVVLIFSVFIYNRFKFTQKQKSVIELKEKETRDQKHIIEEKHKEITDSINYAERIQRSFLATKEMLDSNLNFSASSSAVEKSIGLDYARPDISQKETRPDNYFVFFKPKDVVSGDFYWAANLVSSSEVENDKGTINASTPLGVTKKLFCLATADSTGHGVPGAIMSLLNITSLEKAIETHTQPHEILNATRKIIIERLKRDGSAEGGKDGMDCSLCVYDFKNLKLFVAAANNPVWIVRDRVSSSAVENSVTSSKTNPVTSSEVESSVTSSKTNPVTSSEVEKQAGLDCARPDNTKEIIEIKPDKMPVGKHDKQNIPFTLHEIQLQKGDVIYTLTDGFSDQFGGENNKKFMSKNLRELLAKNAQLPMHEQKQILETTFANWKKDTEQVDDITIIGVRI